MDVEWAEIILLVFIAVVLIYMIIPNIFFKILGLGTWKYQATSGVAITFDDGPNPEITPQILDILDHHGVIATFFVVGEKAARYPELIKMIQARGHQLGAHSNHHQFEVLISPWRTWQDWEDCNATLEHLTEGKILLVRPPWGTFNLCTWLWMKSHHKQVVLWSAEGHDWQSRRSPEQIITRILKRTKPGSILLLHDAGGDEGAPQNTLRALDELCRKIVQDKKLPLVALELPEYRK